jgi:hypothetical protein
LFNYKAPLLGSAYPIFLLIHLLIVKWSMTDQKQCNQKLQRDKRNRIEAPRMKKETPPTLGTQTENK